MTATSNFKDLLIRYIKHDIEFPALRAISVAVWILESGWGKSDLCKDHGNYAGMKWRPAMAPYAKKIHYIASDGGANYCHFDSKKDFIKGYWAFLDRAPYDGWRAYGNDPEGFIAHVGPVWAADPNYVEKVLNLLDDAEDLLASLSDGGSGHGNGHDHTEGPTCQDCGMGDDLEKPKVNRWESTSHYSSRNNTDIDHIVIHYTTSRNIEGTISHFKHGTPRTSAHYIIGQDGTLVQMVRDTDKAWHAGNGQMNSRSIGIEHSARPGDAITPAQEKTSIALIAWLMAEYDIKKKHVIPHKCVKATPCCGDLFKKYGGYSDSGCQTETKALHKWMSAKGL